MVRVEYTTTRNYTSGWYDYSDCDVCLAYWDGDKRMVEHVPFAWFFYVASRDVKSITDQCYALIDDVQFRGSYARVFASPQWSVRGELIRMMRDSGIEPLEADLPPLMRYLVSNNIAFEHGLKTLFFDLETDPRPGWNHIEDQRILYVGWHGADGETECAVAQTDDDKGERELIVHFLRQVAEHDLLVAWNGDAFDEVVLRARCKALDIYPKWQLVNFVDLMEVFKHPYFGFGRDNRNTGVKTSYKLGVVGERLVGLPKIDDVPGYLMHDMWVDPDKRDKVVSYNKRDVDIMVGLENKFGYLDAHRTVSHLCNRFQSSFCLLMGYLNDAFILRWGEQNDKHFPTKQSAYHTGKGKWKLENVEKYKGAYVMEPKAGLYDDVSLVDFASLYPNIIRSFNISPETKFTGTGSVRRGMCVAANDVAFRTDVDGAFPSIVTMAMDARAKYKTLAKQLENRGLEGSLEWRKAKQRSDAWKFIANGSYGIVGSPYTRYYDRDCGEAVTVTGEAIIKLVIRLANDAGNNALYGDTDSAFLHCSADAARQFSDDVVGTIDSWVSERGGRPGYIRLELDADYKRMLFLDVKKRYAGVKRNSEELDIKGLEYVRTDRCGATRLLQKEVLDYLLFSNAPVLDDVLSIVRRWQENVKANMDVDQLIITKSLNKPLDEYKTRLVHVDIAKDLLRRGREVYIGQKISYVITGKDKRGLVAVHVDDFDGGYDADVYWRDQIYPATRSILKCVFPVHPWSAYDDINALTLI